MPRHATKTKAERRRAKNGERGTDLFEPNFRLDLGFIELHARFNWHRKQPPGSTANLPCERKGRRKMDAPLRSAAEPQCDTPSPPSDGGEGRGEDVATPLLSPLPTPSSWGEEEEPAQKRIGATRDDLDRY